MCEDLSQTWYRVIFDTRSVGAKANSVQKHTYLCVLLIDELGLKRDRERERERD